MVFPKHAFSSMDSDGILHHLFTLEEEMGPFFQGSH